LRELWGAGCRRTLGCRQGGGRLRKASRVSTPSPDQDSSCFIDGQLFGIDEVFLKRFQCLVIKLEAQFEDPIGQALFLLEEGEHLGQDGIIVHHRPSTCASAASVWGSQKIISMAPYRAMAADSAVRACSRCPV